MILVDIALVMLAVAFLGGLLRVAGGPSLGDRAIAADVCMFCLTGAFALLSVRLASQAFLDLVLVATLLGFVATVALARLLRTVRR